MRRAVALDFGGTAEISGPRWRKNFDVRWRCGDPSFFFFGGGPLKWWNFSVSLMCLPETHIMHVYEFSIFDVARSTSANFLSCVCSNSYVCRPCSFILFFLCFLLCLVIVFLMFLLLAVAFTVVPIVAAPNRSLVLGVRGIVSIPEPYKRPFALVYWTNNLRLTCRYIIHPKKLYLTISE